MAQKIRVEGEQGITLIIRHKRKTITYYLSWPLTRLRIVQGGRVLKGRQLIEYFEKVADSKVIEHKNGISEVFH